jgi:hypothetical protein
VTDPTTSAAWLVKGEVELGPQRRCVSCLTFWPLTAEFWLTKTYTLTHRSGRPWPSTKLAAPRQRTRFLQHCRACRLAYDAR